MPKTLCIDYGRKKVGLAVSDESSGFVFGRGILRYESYNQLFEQLLELIRSDSVNKIVLGLPMSAEGEKTRQTLLIEEFVQQFSAYLETQDQKLEFDYVDESFSSFDAQNELKQMGIEAKAQKLHEDELAAVIILKKYIDMNAGIS